MRTLNYNLLFIQKMSTSSAKSRKRFKKENSTCKKFFLSRDDFGQPISLTYNEEATAKTVYGGFLSVILKTIIWGYTAQNLSWWVLRNHDSITSVSDFIEFPAE